MYFAVRVVPSTFSDIRTRSLRFTIVSVLKVQYYGLCISQTSKRVSLPGAEFENENKSSGEKNGIEIENEPLELSRISLIKAKSVFLPDS